MNFFEKIIYWTPAVFLAFILLVSNVLMWVLYRTFTHPWEPVLTVLLVVWIISNLFCIRLVYRDFYKNS